MNKTKREYHFIQEIREQPAVVSKSLIHSDPQLKELAKKYAERINRIICVGCGDPQILGIAASYAFENLAGISAESIEAAEFALYRTKTLDKQTLVILISSSGKTVKVIDAAKLAKQKGAELLAITNQVPSPVTAETEEVIQTQAGWSDSFPTKQTTTALAVLYNLALYLASVKNSLEAQKILNLRHELLEIIPDYMRRSLELEPQVEKLVIAYSDASIYTFVGSVGFDYVTAMLAAAKIKETSQSRSEATNLEEYAHLHALSLKDRDPVFLIGTSSALYDRNRSIARWIIANGGHPIVVSTAAEKEAWLALNVEYLPVDPGNEIFSPLITLPALQMFAYYVAIAKNRHPDRPPERGGVGYLQKIIYTSMLEGWEDR